MVQNRRQFTRIPFVSDARLGLVDGEHPVEVLDLSLRGLLIRPRQPVFIRMGSKVVVHLPLDDGENEIRLLATVVHHQGERYGLVCDELDLDSATHLRRLLELNLGDESLLGREIGLLLH